MRWTIAAACAFTFVVGVVILAATPGLERLPPGGRAIPYLGITLAWGFVAVGSFAWLRRPDNRTGLLMTLLGVSVGVSGLGLFDVPALWAIGSMADTVTISLLVHLLLAFPSGRLEGRGARIVVAMAYAAGALQPALVLFSRCEGEGCPSNPLLIADDAAIAGVIGGVQGVFAVVSVTLTIVLAAASLAHVEPGAAPRPWSPCCCSAAVIMVLGLATAGDADRRRRRRRLQIAFIAAFALFPAAFLLGLAAHPLLPHADRRAADRAAGARSARRRATRSPPRSATRRSRSPTGCPTAATSTAKVTRSRRLADGRVLTEIDHEGRRVGALVHAAAVGETPELLARRRGRRRAGARERAARGRAARAAGGAARLAGAAGRGG